MTDELLFQKDKSGIATITLNRPAARNALNLSTMRAFSDAVRVLEDDTDLRAVVLTGAGDHSFCSGGDLFELSQLTSEQDGRDFITLMGDALYRLENLPVPVIAAINGYALGGGSEMAIACDLRIADSAVRIGFVQVRLALTPGWGAGQRLLRLVGYTRAMNLLLSGHILHAEELQQLGLVNRIVAQGTALEHAMNFAHLVAEHSPDVVRGIKALLRAGLTESYEAALKIERDIFPPLWAAEPHLRAVDAFLAKSRSNKEQQN